MEDQELHFSQPEEEKKRGRAFFARLGGAALAAAILASPTRVEATTNQPATATTTDALGNPLMPGSFYVDPVTGATTLVPLPTVTPTAPATKLGLDPKLDIPVATPTPEPTPTTVSTPAPAPTINDALNTTPEVPQIDPTTGLTTDSTALPPLVDPTKALMDSLMATPESIDVEAEDFPTTDLLTDTENEVPEGLVGPNGEPLTPEEVPIFAFKWDGPVLNSYLGHIDGPTGDETFYNLPMGGVVKIMRDMGNEDEYWVRDDGVKMLGKYVMCAADLKVHPRGSIVQTSLGPARVCDTGAFARTHHQRLDIATNW